MLTLRKELQDQLDDEIQAGREENHLRDQVYVTGREPITGQADFERWGKRGARIVLLRNVVKRIDELMGKK